ncbi:MAG: hypothetical protein AB7N91_18175 [Candidatus Tectimicrobiota bacterium]
MTSHEPQERTASEPGGASPAAPAGFWFSAVHLFRRWRRLSPGDAPYSREIFRKQVEAARALLAYGITEGQRPYRTGEPQLTPELIEQIVKAEELLHLHDAPSWQQRAEFEKAYWLLTRSLTPVSASILTMPRWQRPQWFWTVMALVYLCSTVFWFFLFYQQLHIMFYWLAPAGLAGQGSPTYDGTVSVLFFALLSTALVGFIWRFSYWFTGVVTRQKLNQIITFCYGCTLLAVLSPLLLVAVLTLLPPELFRMMALESPIGISLACSVPLAGEQPTAIPPDLRCDKEEESLHYQWTLNIGGVPGPQSWQGDKEEDWRRPRVRIYGGLLVPIYIIVLAFIGGAVSMTRRVPEYQRRAADPDDLMTPEKAREYLVFQIMQLISAPLIAITIYHLVAPASRATAIVLGFASGFASEPILLGIRALTEKMYPQKAAAPSSAPAATDVQAVLVPVAGNGTAVGGERVSAGALS